jgi:hypothetical protein
LANLAWVSYVSDVAVPVFDAAAESSSPWLAGKEFLAHAGELRRVIDGEFEATSAGDLSSLGSVYGIGALRSKELDMKSRRISVRQTHRFRLHPHAFV